MFVLFGARHAEAGEADFYDWDFGVRVSRTVRTAFVTRRARTFEIQYNDSVRRLMNVLCVNAPSLFARTHALTDVHTICRTVCRMRAFITIKY